MVDWIALFVSHGLIAVAFWRMLWRGDLDDEQSPERKHRPPGFGQPGTLPDRPMMRDSGTDSPRA